MRKELEEAFGMSKIIDLENLNQDLIRQREKIQEEIKSLQTVQGNQKKAIGAIDHKSKKGMRHVKKLENEYLKLQQERRQIDEECHQEKLENDDL